MALIGTISIKDEFGNKAYFYKGYAIYRNESVSSGYWGSWAYSKASQIKKGIYSWSIVSNMTSSAKRAKEFIDSKLIEQSINI